VSLIDYSPEDHIAVVRLNRPERLNAKSPEMGEELIDAFRKFNADDADWVGILTGNRRAFCAGRDMKARPRSFPMGWLVHARLAWPTPMAAALNTAENLFDDSGRIVDPKERQQLELLGYQVVEFAEMSLALRPARFSAAGPDAKSA
jgi:enoyl-CoA hydratase/carnithine racemase